MCMLESCGSPFESKREDARYCSAVCRAKASRERRRAEGTGPGPSREPSTPPPEIPVDRLDLLEERLADLEADADAAMAEHVAFRRLARRVEGLEAAIRHATREAVAPVTKALASTKDATVTRSEFARVLKRVDQLERWIGELDATPLPGRNRKVVEMERALLTLARRMCELREEFDALVAAINAA